MGSQAFSFIEFMRTGYQNQTWLVNTVLHVGKSPLNLPHLFIKTISKLIFSTVVILGKEHEELFAKVVIYC